MENVSKPILSRRALLRAAAGGSLALAGCGGGGSGRGSSVVRGGGSGGSLTSGCCTTTGSYTILLTLSAQAVSTIHAVGQKVTLVKAMTGMNSLAQPYTVAWMAIAPTQNNQITWQSNYALYATTMPITPNTSIFVNSKTSGAAMQTILYGYQQSAFTAGSSQLSPGQYGVLNQQADNISFGLLQQATVNFGAPLLFPINIVPTLVGQTALFSPEESIYLFLSSPANNGTVLGDGVASQPLLVTLNPLSPTATVGFDDVSNQFILLA